MNEEDANPSFPTSPSLSFQYSATAANGLDVGLTHIRTHKSMWNKYISPTIYLEIYSMLSPCDISDFSPCILVLFSYKIFWEI